MTYSEAIREYIPGMQYMKSSGSSLADGLTRIKESRYFTLLNLTLRIIGGKYKGRSISVSRSFKARPTTDFAREGLFNILNNIIEFETVKVLDLFGGTGSIGFEFASRGCPSIDIVDIGCSLTKGYP